MLWFLNACHQIMKNQLVICRFHAAFRFIMCISYRFVHFTFLFIAPMVSCLWCCKSSVNFRRTLCFSMLLSYHSCITWIIVIISIIVLVLSRFVCSLFYLLLVHVCFLISCIVIDCCGTRVHCWGLLTGIYFKFWNSRQLWVLLSDPHPPCSIKRFIVVIIAVWSRGSRFWTGNAHLIVYKNGRGIVGMWWTWSSWGRLSCVFRHHQETS